MPRRCGFWVVAAKHLNIRVAVSLISQLIDLGLYALQHHVEIAGRSPRARTVAFERPLRIFQRANLILDLSLIDRLVLQRMGGGRAERLSGIEIGADCERIPLRRHVHLTQTVVRQMEERMAQVTGA